MNNFEKKFDEWLFLPEEEKKKQNPFLETLAENLKKLPKIEQVNY